MQVQGQGVCTGRPREDQRRSTKARKTKTRKKVRKIV